VALSPATGPWRRHPRPDRQLPRTVALITTEQALVDADRLAFVYRPLTFVLIGGAATALFVGWLRPAPWLFALLLLAILSAVWFFAVIRYLRADAWGEAP